MALIGVNAVQPQREDKQAPEKDNTIDTILKGLQVAASAFGIYKDVTDIGIKQDTLAAAQKANDIKQGEIGMQEIPAEKPNLVPTQPAQAQLTPEQSGPLTPPEFLNAADPNKRLTIQGVGPLASNENPPELSPSRPGIPIEVGGKKYSTNETRKAQQELTFSLKDKYEANPTIQAYDQVQLDGNNAIEGLNSGDKVRTLIALDSAKKAILTGVNRAPDGGSIQNADSLIERIDKKIQEISAGGDKIILDKKETAGLIAGVKGAMTNAATQAKRVTDDLQSIATRNGLDVKNLGLRQIDTEKYSQDGGGRPARSDKPSSNAPILTDAELGKMSGEDLYDHLKKLPAPSAFKIGRGYKGK